METDDPYRALGSYEPELAKKITAHLEGQGLDFVVDVVEPKGGFDLLVVGPYVDVFVHHKHLEDARIVEEVVREAEED
ncbi:MAG: hypothetical protein JJT96_11780 [Opitutales bacterium]|nr:hypothetical protein [Opitutales bacterium]